MKKLLLSCLLFVGTLSCANVSATAAANYFSTCDQNLGIGAAVTFDGTRFEHKIILEGNSQTIQFCHSGWYSVSYTATGSVCVAPTGDTAKATQDEYAWSVGLFLNGCLVDASGSDVEGVVEVGDTIILHACKFDVLELKSTTCENICLSSCVSGNVDVRNTSANITIVKIESSKLDGLLEEEEATVLPVLQG